MPQESLQCGTLGADKRVLGKLCMSSGTPAKHSRVLIIDDNPAIHDDFKKILGAPKESNFDFAKAEEELFGDRSPAAGHEAHSFQFDSAFQGKEGLELVQKSLQTGERYS